MSQIKSYVRRNSRLSSAQKAQLSQQEYYLCDHLEELPDSFVGLEIGFGTGDSLLDIASKHSYQLWIGVEVYEKGVASVIRQALEKELENVKLRIGDVHDIIDLELKDASIDHIRIFFPDPWHKKRHHKRRLINQVFLNKLYRILKPGGVVHIATDNAHYAEACLDLIHHDSKFMLSNQSLYRPLTKFAKKAMDKGVGISDIVINKL